jgi:putative Holliday junction resolvase
MKAGGPLLASGRRETITAGMTPRNPEPALFIAAPPSPVREVLARFAAALPPAGRLLALDPGEKRLGLPLSDPARRLAAPFAVWRREKLALLRPRFARLIEEQKVAGLLIGLPLSLSGAFGPAAQAARDWGEDLAKGLEPALPLLFWDERLSTAAVNRMMITEFDLSRRKRAANIDAAAAAYLLQGVLDALARLVQRPAEAGTSLPDQDFSR